MCDARVTRQLARSPEPVSTNFILMSHVDVYGEEDEGDVVPHRLHVLRDQKLASYDRTSLELEA